MLSIDFRPVDRLPKSVPLPSHRHATPSGPWPWMDLESEETNLPQQRRACAHENCDICPQFLGYPQSHFPNWTPDQVLRCRITPRITERQHDCKIYHVDVTNNQGKFAPCDRRGFQVTTGTNERELWNWLQTSVRNDLLCLFLHSLGISRGLLDCVFVLFLSRIYQARCCRFLEAGKLLLLFNGTARTSETLNSYNIEPFFFSSSLNWIPSRYQENVIPKKGDRAFSNLLSSAYEVFLLSSLDITLTLTFLRTMPKPAILPQSISSQSLTRTIQNEEGDYDVQDFTDDIALTGDSKKQPKTEVIDTQAPLVLKAGKQ
jgi:hypothetical protein